MRSCARLRSLVSDSTRFSNREIADRMFLSPRTVETHLSGAYRKLGVANRRELLIWASEGGTLED